jgi:hypothetical protein
MNVTLTESLRKRGERGRIRQRRYYARKRNADHQAIETPGLYACCRRPFEKPYGPLCGIRPRPQDWRAPWVDLRIV